MLRRLSPLIAILVLLAGCKGVKNPQITMTGATLGETTDQAATVRIALRLHNPNNEPLELLEFDYRVSVDGKAAYSGTRSAQMTLARMSTRDIEIPAVVNVSESGGQLPADANVQVNGSLRYIAPGAIAQTLFDTGVRRPRVSFSGKGPVAAR